MTLRGLILGNSHVAALKVAHARTPGRWPGLALDFAGGHGDSLASLTEAEGVLAPRAEAARRDMARLNGRLDYPVRDYDFFAVAGCGLSIFAAVALYRRARFPGLPSLQEGAETGEAPAWQLASRAAWAATLGDHLEATLGAGLATRLAAAAVRAGTGAPVLLAVQPRPSFECRSEPARFAGFLRAFRSGDADALSDLFEEVAAARLGRVARVLAQPEATVQRGLFTWPSYSAGSVRLTRRKEFAHPENDFLHANPDYGALVLDQIAAAVAG